MTDKQKIWRDSLVRMVHLSNKYRSFFGKKENREAYESMLEGAFGVRSSKGLSIDELYVLLDWMNGRIDELPVHQKPIITDRQLVRLYTLWEELRVWNPRACLSALVTRATAKRYLHPEVMSKEDGTKCIIALEKMILGYKRKKERE